ncbi:MAG: tetratricopeptide repeat protein [Verrucomicrobiota bacterium]
MRNLGVAVWLVLTGVASGHGDLHDSIQAATLKIQQAPADSTLFLGRAKLYAAHEDPARAYADFDRAEALGADPAAVAPGRAKLHLATGRYAEACRSLDDLLRHDPRQVEALIIRARARAGLHDAAGSAADYTAAIVASSQPEPEYYLERAEVLSRATPPQTDAAIRGLDEGLARLGKGIVTLQLAALDLETRAGRLEAALTRIDAAAASAPRKELWLSRRGDLLAGAGRPAEARQSYQEALKCLAALPPRVRAARTTSDLEAHVRRALTSPSPAPESP